MRVVDGDTVWIAGEDVSVRLWGVDAPEMDTPAGAASRQALAQIIADRRLACEHLGLDAYGRILGRCKLTPAGEDLATLLFQAGAAREYCHFTNNYYGRCS